MLISDLSVRTESKSRATTAHKLATQRRDFEAAFRLVYERYLHRGLTTPNAWRMRITPYQLSLAAQVFVALTNDSVVSTLTLVEDGQLGLPMESLFQDSINSFRSRGLRLAEVTSLAHGWPGESLSWEIAERLMSLLVQFAARRNIDRLLIAVCPQHTAFYRRIAFHAFGEVRSYAEVCGKPAVPMQVDLARLAADHHAIYQRFFSRPFADQELVPRRMPAALYQRFQGIMDEISGANMAGAREQWAYQMAG